MTMTRVVCVPVTPDGQIGHSWGKAHTVAVATIEDGALSSWETETVRWDLAKETGTEGSHHARVARFIREKRVSVVLANHMGDGMAHMLERLGVAVHQGATGDAREAAAAV